MLLLLLLHCPVRAGEQVLFVFLFVVGEQRTS